MESLTASVILAILVLGVFGSLCAAYQQSASVRADATAVLLARQLADEIVSKPFDGTQVNVSGPRSEFTDVGNYGGYFDFSNAIPPLDPGGAPIERHGVGRLQAKRLRGRRGYADQRRVLDRLCDCDRHRDLSQRANRFHPRAGRELFDPSELNCTAQA